MNNEVTEKKQKRERERKRVKEGRKMCPKEKGFQKPPFSDKTPRFWVKAGRLSPGIVCDQNTKKCREFSSASNDTKIRSLR